MFKNGLLQDHLQNMGPIVRIQPVRQIPDMIEDISMGLLEPPRTLPPKYFYDDRGSLLFDRICKTKEYYPTRTEEALLTRYGAEIIAKTLPAQILELGSGISHKIRRLFDACREHSHICEYAPFDVCEEIVHLAINKLASEYHWLNLNPMIGDYHAGLGNLPKTNGVRMMVFLGSTIGNFTEVECRDFIKEINQCLQSGDYFLVGADRIKDTEILNAAYNDADGITAEFNLNILRVINREIDANFDLNNFSHYAFYNEDLNQIEMYLTSLLDQEIHLGKIDSRITLASGERILTEISRKFKSGQLESLLEENSFHIVRHYEPDNQYFSLILAQVN